MGKHRIRQHPLRSGFLILQHPPHPLRVQHQLGGMVVDPVTDYADLMESLFDFDTIRRNRAAGFSLSFDAMNAVTGPYAHEIP